MAFGSGIGQTSFILKLLFVGFRFDLAAATFLFLPFAIWLTFLPEKIFSSRPYKFLSGIGICSFISIRLYLFVVEYEFFKEFNSRFNTVAVDYLIYPHEVFINIWESYPIVFILCLCFLLGLGITFLLRPIIRRSWNHSLSFKSRLFFLVIYDFSGIFTFRSMAYSKCHLSDNRVLNEIVLNGEYAFAYAAFTRNLDFPAFYSTIPKKEAYARVRNLIQQPGDVFSPDPFSIRRKVVAHDNSNPHNLVLILVESFGSEFWGSLGYKGTSLTPQMDALSKSGMLFTNLYASGNRTVRGLEGVLASFPPLPGDSIVKRSLSDNVSTIARTLKDKNYKTLFLYGGRGVFDGMRSFAVENGYDQFIEQKDFENPIFTTVWGVCDEDLLNRTVEELRKLSQTPKPFFATVLTVSNHKPYTYPTGRISENPSQHARPFAVKYTDYALGKFFEKVKKEPFYKDTIFVVVADHGARVYGSQTIPIQSYKIPMLVLGAGIKPSQVDTLGSSLDVGPTLLGKLDISYDSIFFGRDLLKVDSKNGWAVMNHNRNVSLYKDGSMVVLGLNKTHEFYKMNNAIDDIEPVSDLGNPGEELTRNAIALYQISDEIYKNEKYHLN